MEGVAAGRVYLVRMKGDQPTELSARGIILPVDCYMTASVTPSAPSNGKPRMRMGERGSRVASKNACVWDLPTRDSPIGQSSEPIIDPPFIGYIYFGCCAC